MEKKRVDVAYIKRLQEGDERAFEYIYEFYKDQLFYFALSLLKGNRTDAEEVVQTTFIKILKNSHTLQKPGAFHTWVFRIAYTSAMEIYQQTSKKYLIDIDLDVGVVVDNTNSIEDVMSNKAVNEAILIAVRELPKHHYEVAFLRFYEELSVKEIANVTGVSEGTVKSRLNKIRSLLKNTLMKQGITPKSYYSFGLTPILVKVFYSAAKDAYVSSKSSATIFHNVVTHAGSNVGVASIAATGTLTAFTSMSIVLGVLGVGIGGFGIYQVVQPTQNMIGEIAYYEGLTNKSIEVEVLLLEEMKQDNVKITKNGEDIDFNYDKNKILFDADQNGEYQVEIAGQNEVVKITSIDKGAPKLNKVKQDGEKFILDIKDEHGIDYKKSYAKQEENIFTISQKGILKGVNSNKKVNIILYDVVGNMAEYQIIID